MDLDFGSGSFVPRRGRSRSRSRRFLPKRGSQVSPALVKKTSRKCSVSPPPPLRKREHQEMALRPRSYSRGRGDTLNLRPEPRRRGRSRNRRTTRTSTNKDSKSSRRDLPKSKKEAHQKNSTSPTPRDWDEYQGMVLRSRSRSRGRDFSDGRSSIVAPYFVELQDTTTQRTKGYDLRQGKLSSILTVKTSANDKKLENKKRSLSPFNSPADHQRKRSNIMKVEVSNASQDSSVSSSGKSQSQTDQSSETISETQGSLNENGNSAVNAYETHPSSEMDSSYSDDDEVQLPFLPCTIL